jgi:CheY-like chemotaxis protein
MRNFSSESPRLPGSPIPPDPPVPLRIFIVENHADTLLGMTMYLEQEGHTVLAARSVKEALAALAGAQFDVLLSDIGLPDGDGWELLRRARLPKSVYAIAMSGFGMNADRVRSRKAGYRQHLLKPFDPDELNCILAEAAQEMAG